MYHKHWLQFFRKDIRCRKNAVKMSDYNPFCAIQRKCLKYAGKQSVRVQICKDTEIQECTSRELNRKLCHGNSLTEVSFG